jgi:hypothetical protein
MLTREFWQTFVQLLSFNGYMLPPELHYYQHETAETQRQNKK